MSLRTITAAIAIGAVAVVASSCTDAGSPLFILQNQVPGDGCQVSTSIGDAYNPRGIIDTKADGGYLFTPVVQNVAEVLDGNTAGRIAFIEGADVDISFQSGFLSGADIAAFDDDTRARFAALTSFSKRFSGSIQPSGGLTSFAFTIIPRELLEDFMAARLADDGSQLVEVTVDVKIFGSLGSGDVSSPTFTYPIDVCDGCMKRNVGACADLPADFTALQGGPCISLQDVPIECCTTADSQELCPAVSSAVEL